MKEVTYKTVVVEWNNGLSRLTLHYKTKQQAYGEAVYFGYIPRKLTNPLTWFNSISITGIE